MNISFKFQLQKAIHAMAYLVDHIGSVDKLKLVKLLYIADREHFLKFGHPITGDCQYAMKHGPVPSGCLDAINGQSWPKPGAAFEFLHVDNNTVMIRAKPTHDLLEPEEKNTLDLVLQKYGRISTWNLRNLTHKFPEYEETYVEGTSTVIPYEVILKHHKGEDGFRHGRPVLTEAILAHAVFPFTAKSDADL